MPEHSVPSLVSQVLLYLYSIVVAITGPWTWRNALGWGLLIGFVLAFRWLLLDQYQIPTGSMEPTLHGDPRFLRGDRVSVNKLAYGPRVPFMNKRLFHLSDPQRWDIVVFNSPDPKAVHPTLVKRIVGLPGERIQIGNDGRIVVNGTAVDPPEQWRSVLHYKTRLDHSQSDVQAFILQMIQRNAFPSLLNPNNPGVRSLMKELADMRAALNGRDVSTLAPPEIEQLIKGLSPLSLDISSELFSLEQATQYPLQYGVRPEDEFSVVPPNCYLVLGDNSGDSVDGRYFGWLPNDNILGRAVCIWWPIPRCRDFTGFSKTWWGKAILYGPPLLLAAYEITAYLRRRRAS